MVKIRYEKLKIGFKIRQIVAILFIFFFLPSYSVAQTEGTFTFTGSMTAPHENHNATKLPNGKVLITQGAYAELYDPSTGTFSAVSGMYIDSKSATALADGRVLLIGEREAEIYDPNTNTFTLTGSMNFQRPSYGWGLAFYVTALVSNKVLVVGGAEVPAELYDPQTGSFILTGTPVVGGVGFGSTATALPNSQVLIIGDHGLNATSAQIYDLKTETFTPTGWPTVAHAQGHTATLLPDGKVLIAGGQGYDTVTGRYRANMAELYDPSTGAFTRTGNLIIDRQRHKATLMGDGKVLITGGYQFVVVGEPAAPCVINYVTCASEVYDPTTGSFSLTGNMLIERVDHTSTLISSSTGWHVLITGGRTNSGTTRTAELYSPPGAGSPGGSGGAWMITGILNVPRFLHTATLLQDGRVLIAGGEDALVCLLNPCPLLEGGLRSSEVYNPSIGNFSITGDMAEARTGHTATLLTNGKVLITGGGNNFYTFDSAEVYDPATGLFSPTANRMSIPRAGHTATLLSNGKVLIAGGSIEGGNITSSELFGDETVLINAAELYDPISNTFSPTGNLIDARVGHVAVLLSNGKVLIAGGDGIGGALSSAEIYDPSTGLFTAAGNLKVPRAAYFNPYTALVRTSSTTATLLSDGRVLIAGGNSGVGIVGITISAELYDPMTGTFSLTGNLIEARALHTATRLSDGQILIAGGFSGFASENFAELYNPTTGSFTSTSNLIHGRAQHTATKLNSGQVLVVGGFGSIPLAGELYTAPVTGPHAIIDHIKTEIDQFLATGDIRNQGIATSLVSSLNNADKAITQNNNNSAKGILGAFINKLNTFVNGGQITAIVRDTFVPAANAIIASLP